MAEIDGKIVGHFLFSQFLYRKRQMENMDSKDIVMLAPVSVHADYFHKHVGVTMLTLGIQKVRIGFGYYRRGDFHFYNRVGFKTSSNIIYINRWISMNDQDV